MKRTVLAALLVLLLAVWGCSMLGIFGKKGPQTFTLVFSNETLGELKPCG